MALFLEVTSGAEEGQRFKILPGVRVGRTTGEIILSEPKMSALHAQVKSSENGKLYLVDSGSSNGIKINGNKVQKVALMPGVTFKIGKTTFKVVEEEEATFFGEEPAAEGEEPQITWKTTLSTELADLDLRNVSPIHPIMPFSSLVELHFVEGVQTDTKVVLGYGPRKAGSAVLDVELQDPASPDIAFELIPLEDGSILFRTAHPELILLNDHSFASENLKTGDQIRVGTSLIEVKLVS